LQTKEIQQPAGVTMTYEIPTVPTILRSYNQNSENPRKMVNMISYFYDSMTD
ncbi:6169_t:CDS:1, partial [Funneliformis geosporum]